MPVRLPAGLEANRGLGPTWARWLDRLPRLLAEVVEEWGLTREDDALWHGHASLVAPVVTADGARAALKIAWDGDDESLHEALALQHWHGDGAARLLRADPHRRAMLLERLERRDLTRVWDLEACEIVGGLYARLHIAALPQLASLTSYVERWLDDLAALPSDAPIPRRFREQALSLGRDLVADPASVGRVVHGDLHYENVLAAPRDAVADRGGWLAIDPKPMSGDPHYEPAPMLWNRWEELAGDVRGGLRRRFHALVDAAGLDEDRARDWVVVRMVVNASWSVGDALRLGRALDEGERAWITRCITIGKAVSA